MIEHEITITVRSEADEDQVLKALEIMLRSGQVDAQNTVADGANEGNEIAEVAADLEWDDLAEVD